MKKVLICILSLLIMIFISICGFMLTKTFKEHVFILGMYTGELIACDLIWFNMEIREDD